VNLVVDTSVWSLVLRRPRVDARDPHVTEFLAHVEAGNAILLIGVILQELLGGVRTQRDFDRLRRALDPFPLVPLARDTYVQAAKLRNQCRRRGVQASGVDFLIAAACAAHGFPLLTADQDFTHIAEHSELVLLGPTR